uniref:Gag-pol protein n=1 Tax=Solanum tuberosum TaxID=4113 RepID=M1DXR0_SOLTU
MLAHVFQIMPPRRVVSGHPARRKVEEQGVSNAPEVQPQGEVTNAEFQEAIQMLSQDMTNQVGQQRGARQKLVDTSRIREFLRMNPPSFKGSSTAEDPGNFIKELQKVFEVMHVADAKRVELASYQLKCNVRTWFDQWKKSRADDAPFLSWTVFESAFLDSFFPRELREAKEEKLRDREEFRNKKAKTWNESGQQTSNVNRSSFQYKKKRPTPSSASAPAPNYKDLGSSVSFVPPYVAMNFDVLLEKLREPFCVSTPVACKSNLIRG